MGAFYSLSDYCKDTFGEKLYKLSLSGSTGCPNRDAKGGGGCAFCSAGGSGDFAAKAADPLERQMAFAKAKVGRKAGAVQRYIAYFQSYTGTYGDFDRLSALYRETVARPDVAVLSVATRPDCLEEKWLDLLSELRQVKPVWVELGLQTSNDRTAAAFGRGYPTQVYADAVAALHARNIEVITHIILGLPGETEADMKESVRFACNCGTDGLKLQLLHVLKGTRMAEDYKNGRFSVLSMEEYIDLLCKLIPLIPKHVVLHRLTGDGPKNLLIAPLWSGNKRLVLNTLNKTFRERGIVQGELCE